MENRCDTSSSAFILLSAGRVDYFSISDDREAISAPGGMKKIINAKMDKKIRRPG
jgi:hypothetical protein